MDSGMTSIHKNKDALTQGSMWVRERRCKKLKSLNNSLKDIRKDLIVQTKFET